MSAMAYRLLVPVRLSGNTSQQRRTELSRLSSTSMPRLNLTRPAKNSRTSRFQAGVALRTHPLRQNENCWLAIAQGHLPGVDPSDLTYYSPQNQWRSFPTSGTRLCSSRAQAPAPPARWAGPREGGHQLPPESGRVAAAKPTVTRKEAVTRSRRCHEEGGFDFRAVGRGGLLCLPKVSRRLLAGAPVGLDLVGDLLALHEAAQARAFDRPDVHEHASFGYWRLM